MIKKAIITGITGQDGYYLTKLLLKKNYQVHGLKRRSSLINTKRIDEFFDNKKIKDKSFFLKVSFEIPEYTANSDALGVLRLLEAVKSAGLIKKTKIYQASTSELFGKSKAPQSEKTSFIPRSPYAIAKLYAYWIIVNYREAYNFFACNGILFNHESPLRGETFVTRKITTGLARIQLGLQDKLYLGNIYAKRDWGHAQDFVLAMWKMLQQKKPEDFVIATNKQFTVKDFVNLSCKKLEIDLKWIGKGLNEKGIDKKTNKVIIEISKKYFRPTDVDSLQGNYDKAKKILKWKPKISFEELVEEMVKNDFAEQKKLINLKK